MSIFASQTHITVPIPFDPPHTITIRKLTGRDVERAQEADALGVLKGSARTWAARMRRMAATGDPQAMQALRDPLMGYDRFVVIRAGLMAWSYAQSLTPIAATPAVEAKDGKPGSPAVAAYDATEDLDDEAVEFIATEILRLTKPGLFLAMEAVEDAQKELSGAASVA